VNDIGLTDDDEFFVEPLTDDTSRSDVDDHWVFVLDPAWQTPDDEFEPPPSAVVGGWFVDDVVTEPMFRPNPAYEPSEPDLPTDPVDAMLQLAARGEVGGAEVLSVLRTIDYWVALDETGRALVGLAPDDVPSVLAVTAPVHRSRVDVPDWVEVSVDVLADMLPGDGIDLLLNPNGPASMRLVAAEFKDLVRP
jgi:hypothetical protein